MAADSRQLPRNFKGRGLQRVLRRERETLRAMGQQLTQRIADRGGFVGELRTVQFEHRVLGRQRAGRCERFDGLADQPQRGFPFPELTSIHSVCGGYVGGGSMSVYASHQGIQYELSEVQPGEWRWAFTPPAGPLRTGHVRGEFQFAVTVVQRAIEVWILMNRSDRNQAA
jgi:hypothetical protein